MTSPFTAPESSPPAPSTPSAGGRALVIGGHGALGSLVADELERGGWELVRAVLRPPHAVSAHTLQPADEERIARALAGVDLVVNATPDTTLTVERLVLKRGGTLVNVSPLPTNAVRELRRTHRNARGTVLLHAGLAPGMTNLIAADLLARHPHADGLELVWTCSSRASSGRVGLEQLHRGLTSARGHAVARVPLPQPFGPRWCVRFAETEQGWLGQIADRAEARAYVCLAEPTPHRLLLGLNFLGLLRALPRGVLGRMITGPTSAPSRESVAYWVAVVGAGIRLAASTIECQGAYRGAAAAARTFADAMLGPRAPGRGVHMPEEAFALDQLAGAFWRAGIDIVEQPLDIAGPHRPRPSASVLHVDAAVSP
jgi:hypothetical protein